LTHPKAADSDCYPAYFKDHIGMKSYESSDIRNVGLIGHKASGKTSIAESALWAAKVTARLGSTAQGTSVLDFEDEEKKRVMSTSTAIASLPWKKSKINLLDAPGDGNFLKDARVCMQAMDAAVCVVSAKDGVEPMTERVWGWAGEQGLQRAFFISKMDIENANFDAAFKSIKEIAKEASLVQLPIGEQAGFRGLVDLLSQKAYIFKDGDTGEHTVEDVPADMKDAVEEARNKLIEDIAAADEALMEKFFDGKLTPQEITSGLAKAMVQGLIVPVYCGSGTLNRGITMLLDFMLDAFPSPLQHEPWEGRTGDATSSRKSDGPLTCFCFKTIVDQHAGKISVMRVLSGTAKGDSSLKNPRSNVQERLGALNAITGKKLEAVDQATTGDIFAVAKLKETRTNDTLSADGWILDTVKLAAPLIERALHAKDKGAEDKIKTALDRVVEEDPGLSVTRHEQTGELLIQGSGQQHVEVAVEKMQRKFGVACVLSLPKVPYLETFTAPVKNVEGKHKKQSGGHGQFGVAYMDFEPLPRGTGFQFEDAIVGGSVPRQFIPSVEKGVEKARMRGVLAGYPVVDFKIRLFDGKYHAVDSSDMAFQVAASKGFKIAAQKAKPVLLEPIMNLEITVPEENMGDVMGDVNTRRGRLSGTDSMGKYSVIKAQMPLAEVQQYEATLRSMTQGRGSFTMEFSHREIVPAQIQEKIIKESGFVVTEEEE
jgi:elongation factor G